MPASLRSRPGASSALAVAMTVLIVCSLLSLAQPQAATAQVPFSCPTGQVIYPALGQTCPTTGLCSPGSIWNGTSCVASGVNICSAGSTANGTTCVSAGAAACPVGTLVNGSACVVSSVVCPVGSMWNGAACVSSGETVVVATESCADMQLQPGQACTNGVVTCNGQPVATGTPCVPNVTAPAVTAAAPPTNQYMTCPGGGYAPVSSGCSAGAATAVTPSSTATTPAAVPVSGFTVTYPAGWNIIAGPAGTTIPGATGSLFTLQAGDAAYETLPATSPLRAGTGYWLYVPSATQISLAAGNPGSLAVSLPAGQFVLIGNPGTTVATVSGADAVLLYNPTTGSYSQTTQLLPGQGAWALSFSGGQASITNAPS